MKKKRNKKNKAKAINKIHMLKLGVEPAPSNIMAHASRCGPSRLSQHFANGL